MPAKMISRNQRCTSLWLAHTWLKSKGTIQEYIELPICMRDLKVYPCCLKLI